MRGLFNPVETNKDTNRNEKFWRQADTDDHWLPWLFSPALADGGTHVSFSTSTVTSAWSHIIPFFMPCLWGKVYATLKMRLINWICRRRKVYHSLLQHKLCCMLWSSRSPLAHRIDVPLWPSSFRGCMMAGLLYASPISFLNHGKSALKQNIFYCLVHQKHRREYLPRGFNTNIFRDFHAVEVPDYLHLSGWGNWSINYLL